MTLPLGMVLLFTVCGAVLGGLVLFEISTRGPRAFLTTGVVITILNAGVGAGAACLFISPDGDSFPTLPAISFGVGFALLPLCYGWVAIPKRKVHLTDIAPQIKKFGLRRFADLDRDGDGVITRDDLRSLTGARLNPKERELLAELEWLFDDIGHVIDTVQTPTFSYNQFQSACSGFPVWTSGTEITCIWGVSREDLEKYPGLIKERYINW